MTQVLRAILVTLLVGLVAFGGLYLFRGDKTGLRSPAVAFVEAMWKGEPTESALAMNFEGPATSDALKRMQGMYREAFGPFRGAGQATEEWIDGDRGYLAIALEFEKAEIDATFDFKYEHNSWRIRRYEFELPRAKAPKAPYTDPEIFSRRLLEAWGRGVPLMVWEHLGPDVREGIDQDIFTTTSEDFIFKHGEMKEVKRTSLDDDGGDAIPFVYEIVFADITCKATGTLTWDSGRWVVTTLEIENYDPRAER